MATFRKNSINWIIPCLFVSAGFFLLGSCSSSHEADIFIPVDLGIMPAGLTTTGPLIKGIEVRIRGSKSVIETLPDLQLRYVLDLSGVGVGVKSIPVEQDRITLPKGVSIVKVNSSFIPVKVENEIQKEVPVIISFLGKPASGFIVAGTTAQPSSVILKGPESVLASVVKATTKPIDIDGLSESLKKEIALDLAEDLAVASDSKLVLAEILIEEEMVARKFNDIPVAGQDILYQYSITPPTINIEVQGPVNILEKLNTENGLKVYIDLKDLKPGVYVRRVTITLPVKTALVGVKPEIFTVKIED